MADVSSASATSDSGYQTHRRPASIRAVRAAAESTAMPHPPETIARARRMYAEGEPVLFICRSCGIGRDTLYRWIDGGTVTGEQRLEPLPRRAEGTARPPRVHRRRRRRTKGDRVALVQRLWRAAEAQVRDVEECLARGEQPPPEHQQGARTIATLAKTMRELIALDEAEGRGGTEDDGDMPQDIDEFRRELARRMDAFVAERLRAGVRGEPAEP
jgi:hypothetical protein